MDQRERPLYGYTAASSRGSYYSLESFEPNESAGQYSEVSDLSSREHARSYYDDTPARRINTTEISNDKPASKSFIPESDSSNSLASDDKAVKIGFKTPAAIILCFIGGVLMAITNFVLFSYLHHKRPEDTITQGWLSTIAVILANLTRFLFGASLGIAYVQLVWYKLRRAWMPAKLIDRLLSLPWNALDLFSPRTIRLATFEWLFALCCVLLPILTTFPPGSIKVVVREVVQPEPVIRVVPWMNLTYRGGEGFDSLNINSLFEFLTSDSLEVGEAKSQVIELATNVLRRGEVQIWDNPFDSAQNSSYQVQFTGPKLQCNWYPFNGTELYEEMARYSYERFEQETAELELKLHVEYGGGPETFKEEDEKAYNEGKHFPASEYDGMQYFLWAPTLFRFRQSRIGEEFLPSFSVYFRERSRVTWEFEDPSRSKGRRPQTGTQTDLVCIRCIIGSAIFTANATHSTEAGASKISFSSDESSFRTVSEPYLTGSNNFISYPVNFRDWTIFPDEHSIQSKELQSADLRIPFNHTELDHKKSDFIDIEFSTAFFQLQCVSIAYAMVKSLEGTIGGFNPGIGPRNVKTSILGTPFASLNFTNPGHLDIRFTPQSLEEALDNITMSLPTLKLHGWTTTAPVTLSSWPFVYEFEPIRLLLPYGVTIVISFFLVSIGLYALKSNGVSAKGNSFLQIVTTTSAPGLATLRTKAGECNTGGERNFSKGLLELKLRLGSVVGKETVGDRGKGSAMAYSSGIDGSEHGGRRRAWGFGTVEEVVPIQEGS